MESSIELGETALAADQEPFPREETKMEGPYNESGEEEVDSTPRSHTLSEKRRAENAAFDLWIEQNRSALSKGSHSLPGEVEQSAHALLRDFENRKIITNPRDYQLELFERAKRQNSIAVLDTGSGKTLIAALLLRWTIENEVADRASGKPRRIAFFLVDKVALVFQQHAVMTSNIDYPIEKLCGEMLDGVESKDFWSDVFNKNMAVVCTADILHGCIHHSWIRMDQINLLIFDEAHHAKKNHTYARIIKDFYIELQDINRRPRILGMTASPVDSKISPEKAAAKLEALLHSQIVTVADPAVLRQTVCKPKNEIVVRYSPTSGVADTELQTSLRVLVGHHTLFKKAFEFTDQAIFDLGPWCVDRFWQLFFKEDSRSMEVGTVRDEPWKTNGTEETAESHLEQVRKAQQLVKSHNFLSPALSIGSLSEKVIELIKLLREQFENHGSNKRCIIFVKQRNTAEILADLLQQPEMATPGVRVDTLMGGGNGGYDNRAVSFREQVLTILKFRRGELNCIIATSIAEEGLDIPDCNVIIRFDLYDTLIQYIQSRGRARQDGSTYIHMIEKLNINHEHKLAETKVHEELLRNFCQAMPEDRKLTGNDYNMEYFLRKDRGQRQFTVPSTGAKLNYRRSLVCLVAFVSSLPHPPETILTPEYAVLFVDGGYRCEVTLPSVSPITKAVGRVHSSKAVAKCSAAFEICLALYKAKYLDENLRSTFKKQISALANARLATSSTKKDEYGMRIKPDVWSQVGEPAELHVTAITLAAPTALGRPSAPLLLLSRFPMPPIAPFPLFFGVERTSQVRCVPVPGVVKVDTHRLLGLTSFTLRIFDDIFSKVYEASASNLPYFLAPTRKGHFHRFATIIDPSGIIDWKTIDFVRENERLQYGFDAPDDFFHDKFLSDPFDGSRKFYLMGRRHDLKPTDPVPAGVVRPNHQAWTKKSHPHDIYNYSISLWSKSRANMGFGREQPVAEAELLSTRQNLLDETIAGPEMESKRCFLILEPMKVSALPVEVVAMAYNFPAIIHRVDSNLIALEACKLMGLENVRPGFALEAFTKDCDNSDEVDVEKINFQGGMGNNYERLEFLGDCFLKMATTISLFTLDPGRSEYDYHVDRMVLTCNQSLYNIATEVKLEEYVRSTEFSRRTWYPEGLILKRGKRTEAKRKHELAAKVIADVCEALIGAAYMTTRHQGSFDMAVSAVTSVVKDPKHSMTKWSEYYATYKKPEWQTRQPTPIQMDMADKFHQRMGYKFNHPQLLRCAFYHPSYPTSSENLPSYQRLEFLGDALLDMVCVDYLFRRFPGADPQWLTEHKMAMTGNHFLGFLSFYLEFHRSILTNSAQVLGDHTEYVSEIEMALRAAKGETIDAGDEESNFKRNFWVNCKRPPKGLADVLEAYVGAIFVDSEYDYGTVQAFFDRHIQPWFEDMRLYDTYANRSTVTQLTTLMQTKFGCTDWRLPVRSSGIIADGEGDAIGLAGGRKKMEQVVCGLWLHGKMAAHAVSESDRYARLAAARRAVVLLEELDVAEFKAKYGCDCVMESE